MRRRRVLRGIAAGLLGRFVSRHNDVGGYWALGKLYTHAQSVGSREVSIDLQAASIAPPSAEFDGMAVRFGQMLKDQLAIQRLSDERVRSAIIRIVFVGTRAPFAWQGDVFESSLVLTDNKQRIHRADYVGACRPHDPAKEQRSAR